MAGTSGSARPLPRQGSEGHFSGILGILGNVVAPLLLSGVFLAILNWAMDLRADLQARRFQSALENKFQRRFSEFRQFSTYTEQVEQRNAEFKRRIALAVRRGLLKLPGLGTPVAGKTTSPVFSGAVLSKCFERAFGPDFLPKGTSIFGFVLDPDFKPQLVDGPFFDTSAGKQRLCKEAFAIAARAHAGQVIQASERTHLEQRLGQLVGGEFKNLYGFDLLVHDRKGRLTPGFSAATQMFFLFDTFDLPGSGSRKARPLFVYAITFPWSLKAPVRQQLRMSLSKVFHRFDTFLGFCLPTEAVMGRAILPPGASNPFWKDLREYLKGLRGKPLGTILPPQTPTKVSLPGGDVLLFRKIISRDSSYELWMAAPFNPPGKWSNPLVSICFFVVPLGCCFLLGYVILWRTPPPITAQRWFQGFLFLVGALPLTALFFAGTQQVESEAFNNRRLAVREAERKLEEIDAGQAALFSNFVEESRRLCASETWVNLMTSDDPKDASEAARIGFSRFGRSGQGVKLEKLSWIRLIEDNVSEHEFVSTGKSKGDEEKMAFIMAFQGFDTLDPSLEVMKKRIGGVRRMATQRVLKFFESVMGSRYLATWLVNRGHGEILQTVDGQSFSFHDVLTRGGKPNVWAFLATRPRAIFEEYLRTTIARQNAGLLRKSVAESGGTSFAASRLVSGSLFRLEPPPSNNNFWRANRLLEKEMEMTGRSGENLVSFTDDSATIAHSCAKIPGFIIGSEVSFFSINERARRQFGNLVTLALFLSFLLFVFSQTISHYLVNPILRVGALLGKVAEGDLGVRINLDRNDELGEMTRAFDLMIKGLEERQKLGTFVSRELDASVSKYLERKERKREDVQGAVLVSDIRSFTTISENHPGREVFQMLNTHFELMVKEIQKNQGWVDKFIGDAIVAVFPDEKGLSACEKALRAAVGMMKAHGRNNLKRAGGGEFGFDIGIGIDFGVFRIGVIRSKGRNELTVFGTPRDLAEELEGVSKKGQFTRILASPIVAESVSGWNFQQIEGARAFELKSLESER
jgi:class 3 adenylate cyclase